MSKPKRLDRPDREKIAKLAFQCAFLIDDKDIDRRWKEHKDKARWYYLADELLALILDVEELDKIRDEIIRLNKELDDREEDLIVARCEEKERIVKEFDECFKLAPFDDKYLRILIKSSLEYIRTGKWRKERQALKEGK